MIKILRVKDVAKMLNITPGGVRQRVRRGQLPARKLGGSIIFLQDELEEYLKGLPDAEEKEEEKDKEEV